MRVVAACMHLPRVRAPEVHIHSLLHEMTLYVSPSPSGLYRAELSSLHVLDGGPGKAWHMKGRTEKATHLNGQCIHVCPKCKLRLALANGGQDASLGDGVLICYAEFVQLRPAPSAANLVSPSPDAILT